MTQRPEHLPDYEAPPVAEVVVGIQFAPALMSQVHIGHFWSKVCQQYPTVEDHAPLNRIIEGDEPVPDAGRTEVLDIPPMRRCFFMSADPTWLLQVQADRLLHNWRRTPRDSAYVHFEECLARFETAWAAFLAAGRDLALPEPSVEQLEVTYVNRIPAGVGWTSLAEIGLVLPDLTWRARSGMLKEPEAISWRAAFRLPEKDARLHVRLVHGKTPTDLTESVLLLELTVRGLPRPTASSDARRAWFLRAREAIVTSFADLTSSEVQQKYWRRK